MNHFRMKVKNSYALHQVLVLSVFLMLLVCSCSERPSKLQNNRVLADRVVGKFYALNNHFSTLHDAWGPYTLDLAFEAMLVYANISGEQAYIDSVLRIMATRNLQPYDTVSYLGQPFGSISFELFRATGDSIYLPAFLYETNKMVEEVDRDLNGAVLHPYNNRNGLLIDYVQEYASRLAKASFVCEKTDFFEEAVRQFELYDSLVRFPDNGLYSQGVGFLDDPAKRSPSAWSRGQGWMLRGMVSTMEYLPNGSVWLDRMQKILVPFIDALIAHQHQSGFWHQLVDMPFQDSSPETSGTAFIGYYLALAIHHGFIEGDRYRDAAERAIGAVKSQIQPDGSILNGCYGPGPIISIEDYFRTPGVTNEAHLFGTTLFVLAGGLLLL